uniref:RCC1-like domain-containing protein n=1 Tax=Vannella robusta TaxID=1487602 RepID=A0A7S4HKH9_9EUKA|mmetsp:Transcript_11912/g.14871  ORF Transcript_11912/g.14871 Transcript_11912/m.14871 type:complete len:454 (+) Transcript_11912:138-1499(+)
MKFVMERFGADGLLHSDLAMVIVVDIFTAVGCPVSKETALAIISNCTVKNKQFSMSLFVQWVTETFPEAHPSSEALFLENERNAEISQNSEIVLGCSDRDILLLRRGKVWEFYAVQFEDNPERPPAVDNYPVQTEEEIQFLSCGLNHFALLDTSGNIWTKGSSECGALGHGTETYCALPKLVKMNEICVSLSCGKNFTACVTENGKLWSFGSNSQGQLGTGHSGEGEGERTPIQAERISNAKHVFCGGSFTFVICEDTSIYACGYNTYGQLGLGDYQDRNIFSLVAKRSSVISIACGETHTLMLLSDSTVYSCGHNYQGQLGIPSENSIKTCTFQRAQLSNIQSIACSKYISICIDKDYKLWAFGCNSSGQLGIIQEKPTYIDSLPDVECISSGICDKFIAVANGSIYLFGRVLVRNMEGEWLPDHVISPPKPLPDSVYRSIFNQPRAKSARK